MGLVETKLAIIPGAGKAGFYFIFMFHFIFQVLEEVSPFSQEAPTVLNNWREVAGFYV